MSNYKVGDLASLVSSSPKKSSGGSKLQSLFTEHWNKRQFPIAVKNAKNTEGHLKRLNSDIECNTIKKNKKKKNSDSLSYKRPLKKEMKTDFNSDILSLPNKKKLLNEKDSNLQKKFKKFSEDSVVESYKQNVGHSKYVKAFIRCAKNKVQKTPEKSADLHSAEPVFVKENLFNEYPKNEDTSIYQSKQVSKKKKRKLSQISADELSLMDSKEEEGESEDISFYQSKQKSKKKKKTLSQISADEPSLIVSKEEKITRVDVDRVRLNSIQDLPHTLFIGNLPVSVNRKMLHKLFASFGQIKSVRLRGAVSTKMSIPKKVAEIKSKYHKGLQSHTGFVVFKDKESAKNALSLNGTLIDNHHILVDFANQAGEKKIYNNQLSVFLGNLPFDVDDETVRSAFEECGEIQAVRIVRDKNTGVGKGFGYIQFQKTKAKEKALSLDDVEISGRKIRVKPIDSDRGQKAGPKKSLMMIRNNMAMKRTKESGNKKSVKKLLKKGKHVHQKKKIASFFGEKFVK